MQQQRVAAAAAVTAQCPLIIARSRIQALKMTIPGNYACVVKVIKQRLRARVETVMTRWLVCVKVEEPVFLVLLNNLASGSI